MNGCVRVLLPCNSLRGVRNVVSRYSENRAESDTVRDCPSGWDHLGGRLDEDVEIGAHGTNLGDQVQSPHLQQPPCSREKALIDGSDRML